MRDVEAYQVHASNTMSLLCKVNGFLWRGRGGGRKVNGEEMLFSLWGWGVGDFRLRKDWMDGGGSG